MVLYSNKSKTSTLYKSLSIRFNERLSFAEVREAAAKGLLEAQGVTSFPSLHIIAADGSKVPFEGKANTAPYPACQRKPGRRSVLKSESMF